MTANKTCHPDRSEPKVSEVEGPAFSVPATISQNIKPPLVVIPSIRLAAASKVGNELFICSALYQGLTLVGL